MKYLGLIIFSVITLLMSVGLYWFYWVALDYIAHQTLWLAIFYTLTFPLIFIKIVLNFIVGTIQSAMLNVFDYPEFEIASMLNVIIPVGYGLIAFITMLFIMDYDAHWVVQILGYWILIAGMQKTHQKVTALAKTFKETQN